MQSAEDVGVDFVADLELNALLALLYRFDDARLFLLRELLSRDDANVLFLVEDLIVLLVLLDDLGQVRESSSSESIPA